MKFIILQIFCIISVLNYGFCTTVDTGILEVEYTDQGTSTDFKIIKRGLTSAPTGWYAIGFSKDTSMGDDDVAICRVTSGSGTVEHYRNPSGFTAPVYLDGNNSAVGFSNIQVTFADGVLTCSFRRMKAKGLNFKTGEVDEGYWVTTKDLIGKFLYSKEKLNVLANLRANYKNLSR